MKKLFVIVTILASLGSYGQVDDYVGTYKFGGTDENSPMGIVYIYPKADSTLIFLLELNRGAPSYNSGVLVGKLNWTGPGEAEFSMVNEEEMIDCSMTFNFANDSLFLRSDERYKCGFGYGVYPHGNFKRTSSQKPDYYYSRSGDKQMFEDLDWEAWWKWDD